MINFVKNKPIAFICILAGILLIVSLPAFLWISWARELNSFENVILQYIILGIALFFAFVGFTSAYRIERGHAKSAFRRTLSLYESILEVDETIKSVDMMDEDKLLTIRGMVRVQLLMADDSIEDWREIIPSEVNEIVKNVDKE